VLTGQLPIPSRSVLARLDLLADKSSAPDRIVPYFAGILGLLLVLCDDEDMDVSMNLEDNLSFGRGITAEELRRVL